MSEAPSQEVLEAAHCWEADDRVPGRPAMTEFRRRLRYHQARWREAHGHPIGSQPIAPRPKDHPRLVGNRLPLDYAMETGATFLTAGALQAGRARASLVEHHQTFDHQRWWAELLWSPAMAVNLFGDLAADLRRADAAVHTWWPDAPGTVVDVRFEHSPGRFDPSYTRSLRTFDAAFVLDRGDGTHGVIGVDVKYHERAKREIPRPENMSRYLQVTERSGAFVPGAIDAVNRTDLSVMWLEHLLLLSMLQHPSDGWTWGRYVVVHAAGNSDLAGACARYDGLLTDRSTFASMTVEDLLDSSALPKRTASALRRRYLPT
jgi:hypothetical protein